MAGDIGKRKKATIVAASGRERSAPAEENPAEPAKPIKAAKPAKPAKSVKAARHRHHVYVVELSDRVWNEPRFRKANPDWRLGMPFVYVGMTGLDPDLRFDKHKAGIQANRFVFDYGLRLLPQLYEVYNPMPYEAAKEMEVELAIGLREAGYGVWQA